MFKFIFLICFASLIPVQVNGQNNTNVSAGFGMSSIGATGQIAIEKSKKTSFRLVGGYYSFDIDKIDYVIDQRDFIVNSSVRLSGASLLFDWYPGGSFFKFIGGVGYSMSRITGNMKLKDSLSMGQISFNPDQIGNAKFSLSPVKIMPYLGFGFGRSVPKNKINVQLEFGTYYMFDRSVEFVCDGLIEPTTDQQKIIADNLKGYILMPNISFIVSYKLK